MPKSFVELEKIESKGLVEEYMLLANILVAEFIKPYCKGKTLLRAHADIPEDKKDELSNFFFLAGNGLEDIVLDDSQTLSHSLTALKEKNLKAYTVAMRKFFGNLQAANYVTVGSTANFSHYGLNFPVYTHFTSPIRRYADLLVHRLTTICLAHKDKTEEVIEHMNY